MSELSDDLVAAMQRDVLPEPADEEAKEYAESTSEKSWQDGDISFFELGTTEKLLYEAFLAGKKSAKS